MSFESCNLDFSNAGFYRIVGENKNKDDNSKSNGSGKSAIWEALIWCLTGTTIRGSKDVIRHGEEKCQVSVEFSSDNDQYTITRTKENNKSNLFIIKNGCDVSGKGIRDTEELLLQHLPNLTPSLINAIIILGQGLPMRFTNNSPSGRKEVLEQLSRSDFMIEDLKNRVSSRKDVLYAKIQARKNELIKLNTEFDILEAQAHKTRVELDDVNSTDFDLLISERDELAEKSNNDKKLAEDIFSKYGKPISQVALDWTNEKFNLANKYNEKKNNISNSCAEESEPTLSAIRETEASIKYKNDEIKKLKSITDVCPTCGQKLPNVHKVDTTNLENEVKNLYEKLNELKNTLNDINNIWSVRADLAKEAYNSDLANIENKISEVNQDQYKFEFLQQEEEKFNKRIEEINNILESKDSKITELTNKLNEFSTRTEEIRSKANEKDQEVADLESRLNIQKEFDSALKRDFRGILLTNCINYIDTMAKEYSKVIFGTNLIKFELSGNNISISYNDKEYESMSGGEKKKVDIIIQFAIRSMLCKYLGFSCNILVLDEIFDELDNLGCQKIVDFITNTLIDVNNVYIISHRADLDIPSDKTITIQKDENGISSVIQQA